MPKTIYIPEDARHSGIDITWTPSAGRLDIGGWYDTMVGLEPESMTLAEFFAKLGITEKDVRKALSAKAEACREIDEVLKANAGITGRKEQSE